MSGSRVGLTHASRLSRLPDPVLCGDPVCLCVGTCGDCPLFVLVLEIFRPPRGYGPRGTTRRAVFPVRVRAMVRARRARLRTQDCALWRPGSMFTLLQSGLGKGEGAGGWGASPLVDSRACSRARTPLRRKPEEGGARSGPSEVAHGKYHGKYALTTERAFLVLTEFKIRWWG